MFCTWKSSIATPRGGIIGVLFLLLLLCQGCIRKPTVRLDSIQLLGLNSQRLDILCKLKISNPNIIPAKLYKFSGTLESEGQLLAEVGLPKPYPSVPAYSTAIVPVKASLEIARFVKILHQINDGERVQVRMIANPIFNLWGIPVPVPIRQSREVPRPKFLQNFRIPTKIQLPYKISLFAKPDEKAKAN